jgi:hypothetical protein
VANNVADGWACVAVAFVDNAGNASVTRPMRLCIDKAASGAPCADPGPPPACTGTYNPTTGQVSATPACTPRTFETSLQVFVKE